MATEKIFVSECEYPSELRVFIPSQNEDHIRIWIQNTERIHTAEYVDLTGEDIDELIEMLTELRKNG